MSNTGTWMQRVAQDWLVLELAVGSGATSLGITTGLQFLPFLLLTPFAGLVADRMPKQRLLQLTNLGMALPAAVLGLLAVTGTAEVWHVYVLAFLLGSASAFDAPARQSFVSEIVDPVDLTNAVGLNSASFNAARLVGPGLAGVLIAALGGGAVATGWVILINAVSYAAPIWSLRHLDASQIDAAVAGQPRPRRDPRGRRLRPRPARPAARAEPGLLRRHVRPQLPDHLRADGHRGLRQGARRSSGCSARSWPSARSPAPCSPRAARSCATAWSSARRWPSAPPWCWPG